MTRFRPVCVIESESGRHRGTFAVLDTKGSDNQKQPTKLVQTAREGEGVSKLQTMKKKRQHIAVKIERLVKEKQELDELIQKKEEAKR